jgi:uroporphyrinogen decarboxylase
MAKIVKGVKAKHPNIPITLFSKNGGKYLTYIADIAATTFNHIGC